MSGAAMIVAPAGDEQAMMRRLANLPDSTGFLAPANVDEGWERACEEADRAARAIARMGLYLIWLQHHLSDEQFIAGVDAHDIPPAQAAYAMRVADLVLHADAPGTRERIMALAPARLRVLARLDGDVFAEAVESG